MFKFIDNHAMILKIILTDLCTYIWNKIIYSMHLCLTILDLESTSANKQMYLVNYLLLMLGTLF